MKLLVSFILATLVVTAEEAPLKTRGQILAEREKLYPDLTRIVELTRGAPSEFAAEALLRVAEAPFLADREWKKELIDEAFEVARHAREPVGQRLAVVEGSNGTRASMIAQAANAGRDRLALQMHAVRDELALDRMKAREFFATAGKPAVRRATCEDVLMDDVSVYFETLARIVDGAFAPAEKQKDAHVHLLAGELRKISSPVEVGPAARAITSSALTGPQLAFAVTAFSGALQKITGDDRSFSAVLTATDRDIETLADKVRSAGLSTEALTTAHRQYVAQNLAGARCEDTVKASGDAVSIKPSKVEGKPKLDRFVSSEKSQELRAAFADLMFGAGGRGLPDEQKSTPQWREKFTALGNSINEMKRDSDEPASDFFYRTAGAYVLALTAAPPGSDRDRIVLQYIAFLRTSDMQQEDVVGWFSQVDALAKLMQSQNPEEFRKLVTALSNSGHPVLRLYAEEESLLPQRPAWAR